MTSRFGWIGVFFKRCIRRVLRFLVVEQQMADARIAALEARLGDRARDPAIVALAREVVAIRTHADEIEEAAAPRHDVAALRADLASMEQRFALRFESEGIATSARLSAVLHELARVSERLSSIDALIEQTRAFAEQIVEENAAAANELRGLVRQRGDQTAETATLRERVAIAEDRFTVSAERVDTIAASLAALLRRVDSLAVLVELTQQVDAIQFAATNGATAETNDALDAIARTLGASRKG